MRLSLGTAGVLGLSPARQSDPPTTAYLLLDGRCAADCAFCPQARSAGGRADRLSRITWPSFTAEEALAALPQGSFRRLCIQGVNAPGWRECLGAFLDSLKQLPPDRRPPVSLSLRPRDAAEVAEWLDRGAERIGIPLDAATPEIYRRVKGGSWEKAVKLLAEAAAAHPGRISTHLIVGLGETEREAAETLLLLYRLGLTVGLFAFTPCRGTRLEAAEPPDLGAYRRLQVARWLLATRRISPEGEPFTFDREGRLSGFGLTLETLAEVLVSGDAFRTSGCADCNRPYYNERPGGVRYNYPRPLTPAEAAGALAETGLFPPAAPGLPEEKATKPAADEAVKE